MYTRARLFVIGSVICALMPALRAQKGTSWLNELRQPCAKKYAVYQQQVLRTPSGLYQCLLIPVSGKDTLLRATYDHPSCKDMYRHGSFLFKETGNCATPGTTSAASPKVLSTSVWISCRDIRCMGIRMVCWTVLAWHVIPTEYSPTRSPWWKVKNRVPA